MGIVVWLLFILAIIVIVAAIKPKTSAFVISWKRSLLIAGLYLAGLILLVPILYLLPNKDFIKLHENANKTEALSQYNAGDLYYNSAKGNIDEQQGFYKNSSVTFKIYKKTLRFKASNNTGYNQIFIERKGVDDGKIEVNTYVATHFIEDIDITKQISPPNISFKDGILTIKTERQSLGFKRFNLDFTLKQFKPAYIENNRGMSTNFGGRVVYIRVPKSLEIDKGTNNVNIIN